jgi:hypothetical protein
VRSGEWDLLEEQGPLKQGPTSGPGPRMLLSDSSEEQGPTSGPGPWRPLGEAVPVP